jgi:hypothetical protein
VLEPVPHVLFGAAGRLTSARMPSS